MKFSCQRCQTRYSIADEKVRGKILKVRCKTCAELIIVRERSGARLRDVARRTTSPPPGTSPATATRSTTGPPPIPSSGPPSAPPPPPTLAASAATWFWSADGQTDGPLSEASLLASCRANELARHTHVWREGMSAWQPITQISPFAGALPAPALPPPLPPPAPAPPPPDGSEADPFLGQRPVDTLDLRTDELLLGAAAEDDKPEEAAAPAQGEPAEACSDEASEAPSSSAEAGEEAQLSAAAEAPAQAPSFANEDAATDLPGAAPPGKLAEETADEAQGDEADQPTSGRGISEELRLDLSGLFPAEPGAEPDPASSELERLSGADAAALDSQRPSHEIEPMEPGESDRPVLMDEIRAETPFPTASGRSRPGRNIAIALGFLVVAGVIAVKLEPSNPQSTSDNAAASASTPEASASARGEPASDAPRELTFSQADSAPLNTAERLGAKPETPRDAGAGRGDAAEAQEKSGKRRRKKRKRKKKAGDKNRAKGRSAADGAALAALAAMESGRGGGSQERQRLQALTSRISQDEPSAGLSPRTIKAVIKRQRRGIASCLERHLKRQGADSMDSRKVTLSFVIRRKGTTRKARLSDGLDKSVFGECVKRQVLNWTFPPFAGDEIKVRYPLVLTATQ